METKWTIGEMAKLFDVSTDALRYYEKAGLLSLERNANNRYRNYSYDDLVILMDILFFRNVEIPIKDIRQILTTMNVGDIKSVLHQNQRDVEVKIQTLEKQKERLAQIAIQYELSERQFGQFSIVAAPAFKCKFISNEPDELVEILHRYNTPDSSWMNNIRYMLSLDRKDLLASQSLFPAQIGISCDDAVLRSFDVSEQRQFSSLRETDCLYTILSTDYSDTENLVLQEALRWLKKQGKQVAGPMIGRYLASAHKDSLDYYEVWIAVSSS